MSVSIFILSLHTEFGLVIVIHPHHLVQDMGIVCSERTRTSMHGVVRKDRQFTYIKMQDSDEYRLKS